MHQDTQLELVVRNDFNDPERAVVVAKEMVKDPALLLPNASAPGLLDQNPWAFMLNLSGESQGEFLAIYIDGTEKRRCFAVV